jgi:cation diffusion facilitator CzcD-associated flavoprotein CzcO
MDVMMVLAMWKFRHFRGLNTAASDVSKLLRLLSIRDKELRRKLNPDYDFGCKRPTLSNSYYRTLAKPHVRLETSGIERIEPDGVVARDGTKQFIDTLVLATGFDVWVANLPAIEVLGRDGRDLGKWWRENRFQAYEGLSVPYFPNFLTMASPYAWVGLSWFNTVGYQMRHMDRLFREVQRRGGRTFEVTEAANARFLDRMTELLDDSVFRLGSCATSRSYWFNHSGDAPLFRPTSVHDAVKQQDRFPLSDYAIA